MARRIYYKQNSLKQLRAFCMTAQVGSVSAAAERLFLSQPSVSLQIQGLERDMDKLLFERKGSGIKLTPEGEVLYKLSRELIQSIDQLPADFQAHCGSLDSGELCIAAGESTILYILPKFIQAFTEAYPGIHLKLLNVSGQSGLDLLQLDQADLMVGSLMHIPDDVRFHPAFNFNPVLITPVGHPLAKRKKVTLEEIGEHGLILSPSHQSTWQSVDMVFKQLNIPYKITLEAGGWEVIKKYVELGLGISIVTDICLTGGENIAAISLRDYLPQRSYGIVLRNGRFHSPAVKRFIEMLDPDFDHANV